MIHIRQGGYARGVWAGGTTDAIWAAPGSAIGSPPAAACWAGLALIERDAPYSFFAGRRRLHLPIGGAGVRLAFRDPAETVELARGEPHRFDGERPVHATLLGGPVAAFNLIYRADVAADAALVPVGVGGRGWPAPPAAGGRSALRMIVAAGGALVVRLGDGPALAIPAGDSLVIPADERAAADVLLAADGAPAEAVLASVWLPEA